MTCNRTEFRLLLHAHGALGGWERWLVQRHLQGCPGCREQWEQFRRERETLAGVLVAPPVPRVSDRVALEIGVPRLVSGPKMVVSRRLPVLVLILVGLLAASAARAFVSWKESMRPAAVAHTSGDDPDNCKDGGDSTLGPRVPQPGEKRHEALPPAAAPGGAAIATPCPTGDPVTK